MDEAAREEFLGQPNTAVLSTLSKDGRIHSVPVWYLWQDGQFHILTGDGTPKVRNIQRSGRATLCIDRRAIGKMAFVTAEGPCEIRSGVTYEQRLGLWRHYMGARAEAAIAEVGGNVDESVWLILTPERWISGS